MLELYVAPHLEEFQPWIIFQQDGATPHWGSHVRRFLDATFPDRWIGRNGPTPWPPRSPDITPRDFHLWGMLRTKCFRHHFEILQIWRQEQQKLLCYNKNYQQMRLFVLCLYFLFLVFSLHVSGFHEPIIKGISSCCFYATIWFMQCFVDCLRASADARRRSTKHYMNQMVA